ncbi:hypothetical protein BJV74DRAFT_735778, partial [Russula compacta]
VKVYTDGACLSNGKANTRCGVGIWFGPRNRALRVPGSAQSSQVGEVAAIVVVIQGIQHFCPLEIVTD